MSKLKSKLLDQFRPFLGTIDTEIGELAVFSLRVKCVMALSEITDDKPIDDFVADSYIRMLIRVLAYPVKSVIDNKEPEQPLLSSAQAFELTEVSLNKFSELFLEHHDYLFREKITHRSEKDDSTVISLEYGEVNHPKNDDEQIYEYLYRLLVIENEEQQARTLDLLGGFSTNSLLSNQLNSKFDTTAMIGATLSDSLSRINGLTESANLVSNLYKPVFDKVADLYYPSIDLGLTPRTSTAHSILSSTHNKLPASESISEMLAFQPKESAKRHRKNDALHEKQTEHLAMMVETMSESVEYMRRLDENQRLAAEESQLASKESSDIANRSIKLNQWVLWLTIIGLLISIIGLVLSNYPADTIAKNEMNISTDGFEQLSASFDNAVAESKRNQEIVSQQENQELKVLVQKQSQKITTLEKQQAEQIKVLQEQLEYLRDSTIKPLQATP